MVNSAPAQGLVTGSIHFTKLQEQAPSGEQAEECTQISCVYHFFLRRVNSGRLQ